MNLDSRAVELLDAIRASPDDDAPRLVLADHIADRWPAHAAWIVAELSGKAAPELEQAFLDELPPALRTKETVFWRGFVDTDEWRVKAADIDSVDPDDLLRLAPECTKIRIEEGPRDFAAIAARVQRFENVTLRNIKLDVTAARALASTRGFAHLRALSLSEASVDDASLGALFSDACFSNLEHFALFLFTSTWPAWSTICTIADAPFAPSLRSFKFSGPNYADVVEIVALLPSLVELATFYNPIDTRIARVPRRLRALHMSSSARDDVADALAASPVLLDATRIGIHNRWSDAAAVRWLASRAYGPLTDLELAFYETVSVVRAVVESELPRTLERLQVLTNSGTEGAALLAATTWPRLRDLDVDSFDEEGIATLVRAPWLPQLRRLSIRDNIEEPTAQRLAESLGPRARLEIDGGMTRPVYDFLRARFRRRLVLAR
jgi:uncharacterized protein (TIGR02996 family)